MSQHIRLWKAAEGNCLHEIQSERLDLERRLEEWIEHDISMIADGLLVIGKQVPTAFGGFLDLLCLDANGDLVILELKRDRTPREVTAQILEYASWVVNLSNDRIVEIADGYLDHKGPLEKAFRDAFGSDLPDTLNESHQMMIVASAIDTSSERIIRYLSDVHGVRINAVTFQFFRDAGEEYLARAFLLEPTDVDYKAQSKGSSKRKPRLSYAQLEKLAEEHGVGELYRMAVDALRPHFDKSRTTASSIAFKGEWSGGRGVILSLIPGESGPDSGLRFQVFSTRLADLLNTSEEDVFRALPPGAEPWRYYRDAPPEWSGYAGYFQSLEQVRRLMSIGVDRVHAGVVP